MPDTQPSQHSHEWACFVSDGDFGEIQSYVKLNDEVALEQLEQDDNICPGGVVKCIRCGATHPRNLADKPDWNDLTSKLQ